MAGVVKFNSLVERHSTNADFITVYIAEAHPTDGWSLNGGPQIATAKSLGDRKAAAKYLQTELHFTSPLVVDSMENTANLSYGAIPERLYVVLDGKIVFKGDQGPNGYNVEAVEDYLAAFAATLSGNGQ